MRVRLALPEDAPKIGEIRVSAWRAAYAGIMQREFLQNLDPKANIEQLATMLHQTSSDCFLLVCDQNEEVVGFSLLGKPRYSATEGTAELWALNVAPTVWRKGAGTLLLNASIAQAKQYSFRRMELWCIVENHRARNFYLNFGFKGTKEKRESPHSYNQPIIESAFEYLFP